MPYHSFTLMAAYYLVSHTLRLAEMDIHPGPIATAHGIGGAAQS